MASFKMGQCLIWLPDRAGEYKFIYISVQLLLSSVLNIHHFAFWCHGILKNTLWTRERQVAKQPSWSCWCNVYVLKLQVSMWRSW